MGEGGGMVAGCPSPSVQKPIPSPRPCVVTATTDPRVVLRIKMDRQEERRRRGRKGGRRKKRSGGGGGGRIFLAGATRHKEISALAKNGERQKDTGIRQGSQKILRFVEIEKETKCLF